MQEFGFCNTLFEIQNGYSDKDFGWGVDVNFHLGKLRMKVRMEVVSRISKTMRQVDISKQVNVNREEKLKY